MDDYLNRIRNLTDTTTEDSFVPQNEPSSTEMSPLLGMTVIESNAIPPNLTQSVQSEPASRVSEEQFLYANELDVRVKKYRLKK